MHRMPALLLLQMFLHLLLLALSDWPRLKYALGIIRAAARNLPHTRIYQTAGDAEFDKCVRRKKRLCRKERGQRGQRLCQNGERGVTLCG